MTSCKKEKELVVIGAGQGRTGTASLKNALETILPGKCYHMKDLMYGGGRDIEIWIKAIENKGLKKEEWQSLLAGYSAIVDYPGAPLFEHLMSIYPNAKVILSVRDPHSWVKSVQNTLGYAMDLTTSFPTNVFLRLFLGRFGTLLNIMLSFSMDDVKYNEEKAVEDFNKWSAHVKSRVPAEKLLVFEATMGWKPLCEFLDVPVPEGDYPRTNDTQEFINRIKKMKIAAYGIIVVLPIGLAIGGCYLLKQFL